MRMPFLKLLPCFLLLTSFNFVASEVDAPSYIDHNCTINNKFTSDSPYQFNLNTLLYSLYSKASATDTPTPEFYKANVSSTDTMKDAVYGEYMCRGDVPIDVCQDCVKDATSRITSECPTNKEAIIWYDQCFLRYSHRSFSSSSLDTQPTAIRKPTRTADAHVLDTSNIPIADAQVIDTSNIPRSPRRGVLESNNTLNDAVVEAAISTKKFATKEANLTSSESLYSLAQCTPDLSPQLCRKCLFGLMQLIPSDYITSKYVTGETILNPSCNLRFDDYRFYYKDNQPPSGSISQEYGRPSLIEWNCSTTKANYSHAYLNNLRSLTLELSKSSNISKNNGFYSTMVGNQSNNTVYGLFMCRGDVSLLLCFECVNDGIKKLNTSCSFSKEAIIWYDMCMLRFSNRIISSSFDTQPTYTQPSVDMFENQKDGFNRLLANTLNDLVEGISDSKVQVRVKNFATKTEFSPSELKTLYTLAQCNPNLSSQDCQKCLQGALQNIKSRCLGKKGGKAMNPSCILRFETYRFYYNDNASAISKPPAYPPNINEPLVPPAYPKTNKASGFNTGKDNNHSRSIIIVASITIFSIMLFCFCYYCWQRKHSKSYKEILKENFGNEGATLESLQFNLATIEAATDRFSNENRIGKGGFGEVYKGILSDGRKIAVKRLSETSLQGLLEFKNEVLLIAKLQHRNLVALLGFCLKDQEKILVYEYVTNKSLDYFLFGSEKPRVLNWLERYKIIAGIARGILYLHEHSRLKVIHRDLKPSNILLDDEMNPKISDFGMARMVGINETRGSTNRIVGTLGYMSPEYIKFGIFSEKSDVFSYGVIVLEIISGKNINSQSESHESQYDGGLINDAWKHWRDEKLIEILDPNLRESGSHSEIIKCIHVGLLCVQGNPQFRPSMNEIVQYISSDSIQLPTPQEPAFFMHNQMEPDAITRARIAQPSNNSKWSINGMSESTLFPR